MSGISLTLSFPNSISTSSPQKHPTALQWNNSPLISAFTPNTTSFFSTSPLKLAVNRSDVFSRNTFRCNSNTSPGGPGQNESKSVLDAFFLGKALAEALSERIESTVGEFLSTVGKVQAEQQKQVQEFQDEVLERAKRAKEVAAREAMEAQGIIPKSSPSEMSANGNGASATSSSAWKSSPPEYAPPTVPTIPDDSKETPSSSDANDPLLGISIED